MKKQLINKIRFYQGLGFWSDHLELSDDDLVKQVNRIHLEETGSKLTGQFNGKNDWVILEADTKRVLRAATDILYAEDPPAYNFEKFVDTLERLSAISRGAFIPENIQESAPKTIAFTLNDQACSFVPEGPPDDPLILAWQINPMIVETGYQFKQWDLSPDVFVVAMTEAEIAQVDWKFLPDGWML